MARPQNSAEIVLNLRILPRAKKNEWAGKLEDSLKIRLHAPPVDGKANTALIAFLSESLQVPKSAISIVRGKTSRQKQVLIRADSEQIKNRLPNFE